MTRPKHPRPPLRPLVLGAIVALLGCGGSHAVQQSEMSYAGGDVARSTATAEVATESDYGGGEMAPAPMGGAAVAADEAMAPAAPSATTVTTTTTVTVTVDTPPPVQQVQPERALTAATVADHDRRGNYLDYLRRHPYEAQRLGLDMTRRLRFRVVDARGQALHDARLQLQVAGRTVQGRTHADGVWDYFPGLDQTAGSATVVVEANGARGQAQVHVPSQGDGQDVVLRLDQVQARAPRVLDLGFLIDVTGSMEDELRFVNREVADIVARVSAESPETQVRVGAVFYRDRTDHPALQRIAFTHDVHGFAQAMQSVHASGGGDYPEDLNAGLQQALVGLGWSGAGAVRTLVVISDAPPQRYPTAFGYREAMLQASAQGIRLLPVAASGADREVEFLFRAMATTTSSPYVYLTDDSGIGNPHMEADTDRVAVEYFHDLLTRLVIDDLHGQGMHEAI
ncbi:MAG: hypothetical protein CMN30_01460 [Sandaracinus sp.]|nr:hypothetical protein [Sandaracinus sp.]